MEGCHVATSDTVETCPRGLMRAPHAGRQTKTQGETGMPGTLACSHQSPASRTPQLPSLPHPSEDSGKSPARTCTAPWTPTMSSDLASHPGVILSPRSHRATPKDTCGRPGWKTAPGPAVVESWILLTPSPRTVLQACGNGAGSAGENRGAPEVPVPSSEMGERRGCALTGEKPREAAGASPQPSFPAAPLQGRNEG